MKNRFWTKCTALLLSSLLLASCGGTSIGEEQPYLELAENPIPISQENAPDSKTSLLRDREQNSPNTSPLTDQLAPSSSLDSLLQPVNQVDQSTPLPKSSSSTQKKTAGSSSAKVEAKLSGALPIYDIAVKKGKKFRLKAYAPSGATVQATVQGKTYTLTESSSYRGVGTFQGDYVIPSVSGTVNLGPIVYSMSYRGNTSSLTSEGNLFGVGDSDTLKVQVKNTSATAFKSATSRSSGNYITTVKKGGIDTVTDYYGDMYRLSSAGWVDAGACTPLTTNVNTDNFVSSVSFQNNGGEERFVLHGSSHPLYRGSHNSDTLTISLPRTSGVSYLPVEESRIFSDATVSEEDGWTTLTFQQAHSDSLWGYTVEYSGGDTTIVATPKKQVVSQERPLTGFTIIVDPGHGGKDEGAAGLGGNGNGLVEKQINLATGLALQKELEKYGATVIMTRTSDETVELTDRQAIAQSYRGDFVISLHCNSAANKTGNGVEVYYYNNIAANFASNVSSSVADATNRANRGSMHSCYVVTLHSLGPAILVEMGFLTNSDDYASLQTQANADATAQAITQALLAEVS